jgi:hypothetical protein
MTQKIIRTERNFAGQVVAEFVVERTEHEGRLVSETVRETRYSEATGLPVFEDRAVEPARAREIIAAAVEATS